MLGQTVVYTESRKGHRAFLYKDNISKEPSSHSFISFESQVSNAEVGTLECKSAHLFLLFMSCGDWGLGEGSAQVSKVSLEARRGHQSSWNRSYRHFYTLGTELWFSVRSVCARNGCTTTQNCDPYVATSGGSFGISLLVATLPPGKFPGRMT